MSSHESRGDRVFTLQLFGGPSLIADEELIQLSPMEALLMGVLGSRDRAGTSRQEACDLLWSDGTRADRRQRLAQLLLSTRRKAGDPDILDGEDMRIRLGPSIAATDLEAFRSALEAGAFPTCLDLLDRGFLSDLSAEPTQPLQEWLAEVRVEQRAEVRRRLAASVHAADQGGDYAEVGRLARLQLRLDPHCEEHLRRLMRSSAACGRLAEAQAEMRHFEERSRLLDPDWEPEPETEELWGRLDKLVSSRRRSYVTRAGTRRSPHGLVGRASQVDLVRGVVEAGRSDGRIAILIRGEWGAGKTCMGRLARLHAQGHGLRVVDLSGCPDKPPRPFSLLSRRLGRRFGSVRSDRESCETDDGPIVRGSRASGNFPFHSYAMALGEQLCSRGGGGRIVTVLDNVRHIDQDSRDVISWVVEEHDPTPVTFVVVVDEDSASTTLSDHIADHVDLVVHLLLEPLGADESMRLSSASHPSRPAWDVGKLLDWSAGNPGIIVLSPPPRDESQSPDGYFASPDLLGLRHALGKMWSHAPIGARETLSVLGTGSDPWSLEDIAAATAMSSEAVIRALGFLRSVGAAAVAAGVWRIPKGAMACHARSPEHIDMHQQRQRTARFLESSPAEPGTLANAWMLADDHEKAVHYSRAAADVAARQGHIRSRVEHLERAVRYCVDESQRADLAVRLGRAYIDARQITAAIPILREAGATAFRAGKHLEWLSSEVRLIDAQGHLEGVRPVEAGEKAEELVLTCLRYGAESPAAEALDLALHFFHRAGDEAGVSRVLGIAQGLVDASSDRLPAVSARLNTSLAIRAFYSEGSEGLEYARRGVELSRSAGDSRLALAALNRMMIVLIARGLLRSEEGRQASKDAVSLSSVAENLLDRSHPLINLAVWEAECANYDGALAQLLRLLPTVRDAEDRRPAVMVLCNLGLVEVRARRFRSALPYLAEGMELLDSWSSEEVRAQLIAGLGWCDLEDGRISEANLRLQRLRDIQVPSSADLTTATLFEAKYLRRTGKAGDASRLFQNAISTVKGRFPLQYIALIAERPTILPDDSRGAHWHDEEDEALGLAIDLELHEWAALLRARRSSRQTPPVQTRKSLRGFR